MNYTDVEKRFLLAILSQLAKECKTHENRLLNADAYLRVKHGHDSANPYVKIVTEKVLEEVDSVLSSPVISEEARVRAQTMKDAFVGIKEKTK